MGILDGTPIPLNCSQCGEEFQAELGRADGKDHVCPVCGTVIHVKEDTESLRAAEQPLEDFLREMRDMGLGDT